jgi:hypothetical protein
MQAFPPNICFARTVSRGNNESFYYQSYTALMFKLQHMALPTYMEHK